jgi:DNA-binding transcriptional LysR family regulator
MSEQVLSGQVDVFMTTITEPDTWLGVEIRHLAALDAVASEGSFGRAATRLGYTQSAVSQQIATLERIVGEKLIERPGGPRAVSLTDAGALLLRHAEAIVHRLDAARADIAALRAGETGSLRVGTYQSVGARIVPDVMRRFLADWPGIELGLSEPSTDPELYGAIESGSLDLAFCSPPLPDGPFEALELMSEPYVLVVPAGHPAAAHNAASLTDLGDLALIGSSSCSCGVIVEDALREHGFRVEYAFRSDDNGTLQGLVAAGFGAALMPLLAVSPGDDRVRVLRLEPSTPRRVIAVVWHRDRHRSPAARAFVEIAQSVSAEVERGLVEP